MAKCKLTSISPLRWLLMGQMAMMFGACFVVAFQGVRTVLIQRVMISGMFVNLIPAGMFKGMPRSKVWGVSSFWIALLIAVPFLSEFIRHPQPRYRSVGRWNRTCFKRTRGCHRIADSEN